jgi:hypothetical protein
MSASNRPQAGNGHPVDHHLTGDELNRYLDHDLSPAERAQAEAHLSTCPECRATLGDMQVLASLLQELPEIRPPRSFQLGPEHVRQPSFWSRLGAMLMPMLPAMRAATVALALMLGGVTAFRVIDESPTSGPVSEQAADLSFTPTSSSLSVQMPAVQEPTTAPTSAEESAPNAAEPNEAPANKSSGASGGAGAPAESGPGNKQAPANRSAGSTEMQLPGHPGPSSAADDSSAAASSGPANNTVMIAVDAASPTASPTATVSPTASPTATATATATPSPTPTPAPAARATSEDDSWLGWVQGVLAVLLVAFGAGVVGLTRFRNRLP